MSSEAPLPSAKVWPLPAFLKHVPAAFDWLVDGLLAQSALSLLVAKQKIGKSTLIRCLAAAISGTRDKWMGRSIRTGTVLHYALEEGPRTVRNHYAEIEQISGANADRIFIVNAPPHHLQPNPLEHLDECIDKYLPDLVIIDTLFRFVKMPDGNEYGHVTERMQPLINLAHSNHPHIMVTHHAGKARGRERGDEILGSTGLGGSVDVNLYLQMNGNQRSLSAYGRDIEDFPDTILHMDENRWIEPMGTVGEVNAKLRSDEVRDAILDYLDQCGAHWQSGRDIRKGVGMKGQDVSTQLGHLNRLGDIQSRGDGTRNSPYEYKI